MIRDLLFNGEDVKGEVGIEIEVEGENLPFVGTKTWRTENDGSLKAREAYEYVLKAPVERKKVGKSLSLLKKAWDDNEATIHESFRAGIHIHINVRDLSVKHMVTFAMLYYLFEDQLLKWCGEDRVGNHFCLSSKDAEYVLFELEQAIVEDDLNKLYSDNIRYSSLNFKALVEYGSLEFRGMRSTGNIEDIETWVKLLLALKDYAVTLNSPVNVIENLSMMGINELANVIFKGLPIIIEEDWGDLAIAGMRRVQPIAYCTDWEQELEQAMINIPVDLKFEHEPDERNVVVDDVDREQLRRAAQIMNDADARRRGEVRWEVRPAAPKPKRRGGNPFANIPR